MVDISNKALALVLVASIFVSLGGTLVSLNSLGQTGGLTGYALSDQGTANITIEGDLSIEFTTDQVDLGSGYTNDSGGGMEYCTFDTNGTDPSGDCVGFNSGLSPFTIENIGNQDATLSLNIDTDAATLIGGNSPVFEYAVENAESGSCSGATPTTFTDVSTMPTTICPTTGFNFESGNDLLNIHVNVSVPQDATTGSREATLTATASS